MKINEIYCMDNVKGMSQLPDNFVDLTVTSPPYDKLRNYNGYSFDFESVAKQLYRITKDGGVVVWVVGDSVVDGSETGNSFRQALFFMECGFSLHDTMIYEKNGTSFPARRDGNRYSQIFEYMFVFSKGKPKTHKLICDKPNKWEGWTSFGKCKIRTKDGLLIDREKKPTPKFSPRNNIWRYNTGKGYTTKDKIAFEHPAIFPEQLVNDHIISWSNINNLVFDPFMGSGTTAKIAKLLGRNYLGFEISREYVDIANRRLSIPSIESA